MEIFHFLEDGYTHGSHVYLRGEHLEVDTDKYPHFKMTLNEQLKKYGKTYWKSGVWDGALHDVDDPSLTSDEVDRLNKANREIIALREKYEKSPETTSDTTQEPVRKRAPAKT